MDADGNTTYVQKEPLLKTNLVMAVLYVAIMTTALVIGTIGNTLILIVSACVRGINKTGKEFIINQAVADFCVTAIAEPLCIIGVIKGEAFFDDMVWLCEAVASMCLTACLCAFMSLTLNTVNRYVYLCHNRIYDKIFNRFSCVFLCFLAWILAFLCEFSNFTEWGGHYFDDKNHQCMWDRTASLSHTMFVTIGLIGGPLIVMAIFYFLIFRHIWETKWSVYKLDDANPARMKKAWMETVRSSKTLFGIFLVFVVCWTPYAFIVAVDIDNTFPTSVHFFITLLAHFHSSVNFIIYTVGNKRFRVAVIQLLGCKSLLKAKFSSNLLEMRKDFHSSSSEDNVYSVEFPKTPSVVSSLTLTKLSFKPST